MAGAEDDRGTADRAPSDLGAASGHASPDRDAAAELAARDTRPDPFFDPERDMPVRVGKRFEILARLGGGGMGEVFKARDRELDEVVALKILSRELDGDPQQLERLRREVKLARRISSPRVCRIHDIVELPDGSRAVTMQLVPGRTLLRHLKDGAGRDWMRTAKWAADIAEGLGAAHALGIVHRDLKPENVMIDGEDRAVILDFGVAYQRETDERLTAAGIILGTLLYMAPEQLSAAPLDGRADLYALGLVMAEALTGTVPFAGARYEEMLKNRVITPQPYLLRSHRPQVPAALDRMVNDLLAADREKRPGSAFYVMSELRALISGDEPSVMVPVGPTTAPISSRDVVATSTVGGARLGPVIGAVSALAVLLVGGVVWLSEPGPARAPVSTAPRASITGPGAATPEAVLLQAARDREAARATGLSDVTRAGTSTRVEDVAPLHPRPTASAMPEPPLSPPPLRATPRPRRSALPETEDL